MLKDSVRKQHVFNKLFSIILSKFLMDSNTFSTKELPLWFLSILLFPVTCSNKMDNQNPQILSKGF